VKSSVQALATFHRLQFESVSSTRHDPDTDSSSWGKTDPNPLGDKANHTSTISTAIADPIYHLSLESNFEGDREVYMVGQGDEPPEKTIEEIQWEAKEEIARAARLARDAERGKRHNDMLDNLGASDDESRDGAPPRRHHPKLNPWRPADQD
jgi:hypothetical protein